MGLVKLYRATGDARYLKVARFLLDARGPGSTHARAYNQSHARVVEQDEAIGHAVRATYMYSGMADVAALTGEDAYASREDPMAEEKWCDVGSAEELARRTVTPVRAGTTPIALVHRDGTFSAISGVCNHTGGPLGEGRLDGDYVVCPWHNWKFHHRTGEGEPGFEEDRVPSYAVKVDGGRVLVDANQRTPRHKNPHEPHPLARPVRREPGPVRVAGISTTVMDRAAAGSCATASLRSSSAARSWPGA